MAMGVYDGSARQFGDDLAPSGPAPAAAPRVVPEDFVSQSAGAELREAKFFGTVFAVPFLIGLGFLARGETGALFLTFFSAPFLLAGGYGVRKIFRKQNERKAIYRHGLVAAATVYSCRSVAHTMYHTNRKTTVKHHVHEVEWTFVVGGQRFEGSAKAASAYAARLQAGDPLWVLVDPNDFGQSMEWPIGFALNENSATAPQDGVDPAASIRVQDQLLSERDDTSPSLDPVTEDVIHDYSSPIGRVLSAIVGLAHTGIPLLFLFGSIPVLMESSASQRLVLLAVLTIPVFFVINGVKLIARALKGGHTET